MKIVKIAIQEFWNAPLATLIGITVLGLTAYGVFFASSENTRDIAPNIAVVEEFTQENSTIMPGKYATYVVIENVGGLNASVRAHVIMLTADKRPIAILNDEGSDATQFEIQPTVKKVLVGTSDVMPTYLIACIRAEAPSPTSKGAFSGAYEILPKRSTESPVMHFILSDKEEFAKERADCSRYLES